MKNRLIYIEDKETTRRGTVAVLDLVDVEIIEIDSYNEFVTKKASLFSPEYRNAYLVDLHLGGKGYGFGEDGRRSLKDIREADPGALVIVHSAFGKEAPECFDLGTTMFFQKGTSDELNLETMGRTLKMYYALREQSEKKNSWTKVDDPVHCLVEGEVENNFTTVIFPNLHDKKGKPLRKFYPTTALQGFRPNAVVDIVTSVDPGVIQTRFTENKKLTAERLWDPDFNPNYK